MQRKMIALILLIGLVAACAPISPDQPDAQATLDGIVAQTFSALTAQAGGTPAPVADAATQTPAPPETVTVTPTPVPGSVSGTLSYPSEYVPPLRVVAFQVDGYNYRYVDTMENDRTYQITGLIPGIYHIVAYLMDGSLAGGYTYAVPCGLSAECTDHTLMDVTVKPGEDTPNIAPADWYAPLESFPSMP